MNRFNRAELSAVMTLPPMVSLMLNLPVVCSAVGGSFALISALIAAAAYLLMLSLVNYWVKANGPFRLSKTASVILSVCLILFAGEKLYMISQATSHLLLPRTHTLMIATAVSIVAALVAVGRSEPCASVCSVVLWPTVIANAVIFLVGGNLYSVSNILPVDWSFGGTAAAAVALISYSAEGIIIALICGNNCDTADYRAASLRAGVLVPLFTVLFCCLYSLATPAQGGTLQSFGFADIARNLQLGSFFQRMEGVYLFVAVIAATVSVALSISACGKTANQFIKMTKKNNIIITVIITLGVLLISAVGGYGNYSAFNLLTVINCSLIVIIAAVLIVSLIIKLGKRRAVAAVMTLLLAITLCGCADYSETDNDVNAVFVGVDRADDAYSFCFKTMNGEVFDISAETLSDATVNFAEASARRLRLMHIGAIIVSSEVADEITHGLIDEIIEHREIKSSTIIMVSDGAARDIVSIESLDTASAKLIENNIKSSAKSVHCTVLDVYSEVCCRGIPVAAPMIGADNGNYSLGGAYLFGSDMLLDGDMTVAYNLMRGQLNAVEFDNGAALSSYNEVSLTDNVVRVTVNIETKDYSGSREELADSVCDYCRPLLNTAQKNKIDILAAEKEYLKNNLLSANADDDWSAALDRLQYELNVKVN